MMIPLKEKTDVILRVELHLQPEFIALKNRTIPILTHDWFNFILVIAHRYLTFTLILELGYLASLLEG